jgi:flagellar biosynthesis component FlhA
MSETIRSWIDRFLLRQELVVLSGVILFLTGLLLVSPFLKIVAFLLSGSLFAYAVVTRWRPKEQKKAGGEKSSVTLQEQEAEMKKLVFDDLQPTGRKYHVDVVEDPTNKEAGQSVKRSQVAPAAEYEFQASDFFDVNEDVFVREGGRSPNLAF